MLFIIFQSDNSGSEDLTAIQNICTCFGIGGLFNAKKRYVTQPLHDLNNVETDLLLMASASISMHMSSASLQAHSYFKSPQSCWSETRIWVSG